MVKDDTAIYLGSHKFCYRGEKDGVKGIVYIKGDEKIFKSCDKLMQEIYSGPFIQFKDDFISKEL